MFSMIKLSEQKIMVYCDFEESIASAVAHGLRIAGIFKKELCLFHPLGTDYKGKREEAQKKLETIIRKLKPQAEGIPVSSLTLKGNLPDTIDRIIEDYDGIMLVLTTENIGEKIAVLPESQIPFLFVSGSFPEYLHYDRVLLPVDTRAAIKNASLWASYFCRFNRSHLSLLAAEEKKAEQKKQVGKNIKFINDLFSALKLELRLTRSDKESFHLPADALKKKLNENYNLMIIVSERQFISSSPLSVEEIIKAAGLMPVLCINANRDMYILCD